MNREDILTKEPSEILALALGVRTMQQYAEEIAFRSRLRLGLNVEEILNDLVRYKGGVHPKHLNEYVHGTIIIDALKHEDHEDEEKIG